MQLRDILQQLPAESVENLARDRLSQVTDIRLPQSVLIDELAEILGSSTYVTGQLVLRHPPCFEILDLLLNAPEYTLPAEGFRSQVDDATGRLTRLAKRSPIFPRKKEYDLYLRMLFVAWDHEHEINLSEAHLLEALRTELGITRMEHFVIEHHAELQRFWRKDGAYESERNQLLKAGMLFVVEGQYLLPEETASLIRRAWGMELSIPQLRRLLDTLSNEDLRQVLESDGLNVSGTADERKARIFENYVLPRDALQAIHINRLRETARILRCNPYGNKNEVIDRLLDWLDSDEDIRAQVEEQAAAIEVEKEPEPEEREVNDESFAALLGQLTNESLYDILSQLPKHRTSGSKAERVSRLVGCPYSERSILRKLSNAVLHDPCRQARVNPYGPKDEKIGRLLEMYAALPQSASIASRSEAVFSDAFAGAESDSIANPTLEIQLPRLASVRTEFPLLDDAEQIVLGYLLDFKSLSDPELDRLVQRFALPWILPKAQMDELIRKLQNDGRILIHVRTLAGHNIYEIS